jgi:N-acetylglucosaminyldiphosphoundecaprenol N-acetyl-beta-D-mannosaminyltransferase
MSLAACDDMPVVQCVGVPVTLCGLSGAAAHLVALALEPREHGAHVHLCSADTLVHAAGDRGLREVLVRADLNLPDGMSVLMASRRRAHRVQQPAAVDERIPGTDLMLDVFRRGQEVGLRHFLLGSTPAVLAALQENLRAEYPRALIVGTYSPPFRPPDSAEFALQAAQVAESGAQIVWVGLGSPKQDRAVAELAARVPAVFVAVGAAFDFISGNKTRAPRWMQRLGLEWVHRLLSEPRRLWRRYLIGLPRFAWLNLPRPRRHAGTTNPAAVRDAAGSTGPAEDAGAPH